MASSSSSSVMAPSSAKACSYDVFLSFSGEDTRNSFTDHLYFGLKRAGIHTFRDNEGINKGEELQPEFKKAIEESRASIVVLSKNYAASTWCLDELWLILQQRKECNHFVLPVFYGVEPTDVRNLRGNFDIQVKPSSKWTDHNVNKWKTALMQVADLAGHVLSGPETSFLKEIIDTIYNELDRKEVCLPLNIVGTAIHDEGINSWLEQCNLEFLVIYGMGGSGKTTLAKNIYHSNFKKFESVSFLDNSGRVCEGSNGLCLLQEQLLKDISGGRWRKIPAVSLVTPKIEMTLKMNKALIVLDDIVEPKQLVSLLGTGEINAQSKIIITTRENIDKWFDLPYRRCHKYQMTLLNDAESSQLLCCHAFGSKTPIEGFEEFVLQVVQYCEGNPLALEVLGSSFSHNNTINYWRSRLKLLDKDMHLNIQNVLQTSYESLPYGTDKMLFLHIACFFVGKDMNYVEKILEPDYSAISGIPILINRCLVSVSSNKKLTMHRLLQEMGKNIVRRESDLPANRSRVWLSGDSYKILRKRMGSETVEGLALDMKMLSKEDITFETSNLSTDAINKMDRLKYLQLNFVELNGSYENFSEDLRWLCWLGYHLRTIAPGLYMRNLVAIDMSYSKLEVFEPPMDLQSLHILNLKDSQSLTEIRNISKIPHLETLILWNCCSLVNVCNTLGDLEDLALLNMTGCNSLTPTFPLPSLLHRLFLKDCHLECTDSFPLSFSVQLKLEYLNLANSLFESLPCYNHLDKLRVLDLSFCSRLKCLICLPSTLAELYIYGCAFLERITFQFSQFTLQEFGYLGCIRLYEVEGFFKLIPITKLDETDLGHMKWLKKYQYHEVCLVGDDELTVDRSWHIQMLYEFDIMSTSLQNVRYPNMTPEYISKSSSLSFDMPLCPKNKRLKGIDVTFKYGISSDECAWFCKISMVNGVGDLLYNPKVFGKPESGDLCVWLSYWPIGHTLKTGDTVNVSIVVLSGLEVHECGVTLVYSDVETFENNMECEEILGGNLSGFHLSTGAYYLCRRDFFELVEVGRLTPDWFRILAGDTIDYTEVRGWRKVGRPKQVNPSFIELKTIRCIIHGPQMEDIYNMAKMSKSSIDETTQETSNLPPLAVDKPADDGHNWRKYGQKHVKGSEYPRSYYKCTHPNCPAKKKVERSVEGLVTEIIYKGQQHNHQPPQSRRGKDAGSGGSSQYEQGSEGQTSNFNHPRDGRSMHSLTLKDQESSQTAYEHSGSSDSDEVGDDVSRVDERHEDEPQAKRRNTEVSGLDPVASHRAEPRIIVQTTSEVDLLDDGYRWRKYGQKVVKGNPHPRSYYKCTSQGCNVRKHVERAASDPKAVITTYEGKHTHDVPAAKNSSHNLATATTTAQLQPPNHAPVGAQTLTRRPEYPNRQQPTTLLQFKEEQFT